MTTETFVVPGMSCQHCVKAITNEVTALTGVQDVQAALDTKTVTIIHTDQVTTAAIVAAINEAGYDDVQVAS